MDFGENNSKSLGEIITPLRVALQRYAKFSVAPAIAITGLIWVLAIFLPSYYSSEVLIFIQEQRLPGNVIKEQEDTKMHEKLDNLMQQIMARSNLRDIIERYDLYSHLSGIIGKEKAVSKFRAKTNIAQITSPTGKPISNTFRLSYTHKEAETAFKITKALSQMFIERSILVRKEANESTKRFLRAEIKKTKEDLEVIESNLQNFITGNMGALPEQLQSTMTQLTLAQKQLEKNSSLKAANRDRKRSLEEEIRIPGSASFSGGNFSNSGDPFYQLDQLKNERSILLTKYSKDHPDIQGINAKIASLQASLKGKSPKRSGVPTSNSPIVRQFRVQLSTLNAEYARLVEEDAQAKASIEKLKEDLNKIPFTKQELTKIRRDYEVTQVKYQNLLANKDQAEIEGEAIRSLRDAQFKVIEPGGKPAIPDGPPRVMIGIAGLVFGILSLFLIPVLLFYANGTYKFRDEVESDIGVTVLSTVPPMLTPEIKSKNRKTIMTSIVISVFAFLILSASIVGLILTKVIDL